MNNTVSNNNVSHIVVILLYILLTLILSLLFYTKDIVIDSNLLISIDPLNAFKVFTASWDSIFGFGQSFNWSAVYLFPYISVKQLLILIFGHSYGQSLFFSLPFLLGTSSIHFLLRTIFVNNKTTLSIFSQTFLDIVFFCIGLFYVSNIYFILVFVSATSLTYTHVMLPFQIGLLIIILRSERMPIGSIVLFAIATLLMSGTSPPYILISFIILLIISVCSVISTYFSEPCRNRISLQLRKLFTTGLITLVVNAIWIMPLLTHFLFINTADMTAALIESPEMHNKQTTYLNVFRNMGLWAFGGNYQGKEFYSYAQTFLQETPLQFLYFSGTIAFVYALIINKSKKIVYMSCMFIIFVPLVVGINQGLFTGMYRWIYDNIPGFAIFRGSYKFVGMLVLIQMVSIGYIVYVQRRNTKQLIFTLFILVVLVFINGSPIWTKTLIDKDKYISNIPKYYYQLGKYFDQDPEAYRVMLLPDQYLAFYDWGRTGANVEVIWQKPLVSRMATSPMHPMNIAVNNLMRSIKKNDKEQLDALLSQYNIKYIVVRNDVLWNIYPDLAVKKSAIETALKKYPNFQLGKLKVFRNTNFIDRRLSGSGVVGFRQISPVLFRIDMKCSNERTTEAIKFIEKKDTGWNFYAGQRITNTDKQNWFHQQLSYVTYLFERKLATNSAGKTTDSFNEWIVDVERASCHGGIRTIDLFYTPQVSLSIGIFVTLVSVSLIMIYACIKLISLLRNHVLR